MYCYPKEHDPPHFHAYCQSHKAIIDINTCELKDGELPSKQNGKTLVIVTYNRELMEKVANRMILMEKGKVQ